MPRRFVSFLLLVPVAAASVVGIPGPAWAGTATVTVDAPDTPNLAGQGQLRLTLFGTKKIDVTQIDPETVRLRGDTTGTKADTKTGTKTGAETRAETGAETGAETRAEIGLARWTSGQPLVVVTDADSDGLPDLGLFFDKQAMRDAKVLTAATTQVTVSGTLPDGRTVTGSDKVAPNVVLEVKFSAPAPPARPRHGKCCSATASSSSSRSCRSRPWQHCPTRIWLPGTT